MQSFMRIRQVLMGDMAVDTHKPKLKTSLANHFGPQLIIVQLEGTKYVHNIWSNLG